MFHRRVSTDTIVYMRAPSPRFGYWEWIDGNPDTEQFVIVKV